MLSNIIFMSCNTLLSDANFVQEIKDIIAPTTNLEFTPVDNSGASLTFIDPTYGILEIQENSVTIMGQIIYPVTGSGLPCQIQGIPNAAIPDTGKKGILSCMVQGGTVPDTIVFLVTSAGTMNIVNQITGVAVFNNVLSGATINFSGSYLLN